MTEHRIEVPGGRLRVREHGQGPPVLFVHGALVNGHLWDGVVDALGDRARAIVPDFPLGAHRLPMDADADLSFAGIARMGVAVLDALDVDRAVVVANDTGGVGAQILLVDNPDRVLGALLATVDCYENFPPRLFAWFPTLFRVPGGAWTAAQLMRTGVGRRLPFTLGMLMRPVDQARAERLMGALWTSSRARADLRRACATISNRVTLSLAGRFGACQVPVHIAWTENDRVFPVRYAERLASDFPRGKLVAPIAGARSLSPVDEPGQVAARITDLLREVEP